MINFIKSFIDKRDLTKKLLAFYVEMKKNLESFYVMDQREYFRPFPMEQWRAVGSIAGFKPDEKVLNYAVRLEAYNVVLADHEQYEKFYTSSMDTRTRENAKVLNAKRDDLKERFLGLDGVIKPAVVSLTKALIEQGILKKPSK